MNMYFELGTMGTVVAHFKELPRNPPCTTRESFRELMRLISNDGIEMQLFELK
jgi:hypothetical protein